MTEPTPRVSLRGLKAAARTPTRPARPAPVPAALLERARAQAAQRKAEEAPPAAPEDPPALCRVLKAGDGRISTGHHFAGHGDAFYEKGETFVAARSIALALEDRGLAEIQDKAPDEAQDEFREEPA